MSNSANEIKYKEPRPCDLGKRGIESLANLFAERLGYKPGGSLTEVVEKIGGKIVYVDFYNLQDSDSGSIKIEPDRVFEIRLANHTSKARDKFTIAHELGHFVLHFMIPFSKGEMKNFGLKATRYGSDSTEAEANYFAGVLLMPKDAFEDQFTLNSGNLVSIADHFGVSVRAAEVRAEVLGLLK